MSDETQPATMDDLAGDLERLADAVATENGISKAAAYRRIARDHPRIAERVNGLLGHPATRRPGEPLARYLRRKGKK